MLRLITVFFFVLISLTMLAPDNSYANCGEDNQPACSRKVTECFTDDITGIPYCGFNYEYFCNHNTLEVEGWFSKVCKNRAIPKGLTCCTKVNYTDQFGGRPTTVNEGFYGKADLNEAWIVLPNRESPDWCVNKAVYKNPYKSIPDWADYGGYNARLIINANFFDIAQHPYKEWCTNALGWSMSNKVEVSEPTKVHGTATDSLIFFTPEEAKKRGRQALISADAKKYYAGAVQNAVSGFSLLQNGKFVSQPYSIDPDSKRPRAAVGLTADGNHLILIVVNPGHDDSSKPGGTTLEGLASYLKSLGAYDALTLDGSGSAQLDYYDPKSGKRFRSKASDTSCPLFTASPCYRPIPIFLGIG